jgi:hypothetical protein
MRTQGIALSDWQGVFSVPSFARQRDSRRSPDWPQNQRLFDHIRSGGITRFLYGGNAFLYHMNLADYADLLSWLAGQADDCWCIPSAGPSFGRLEDQAPLLRRHRFPLVMHLPCADPRDASGLEAGLRDFAHAAGTPLLLYVKDRDNFGANHLAGLDAIARLIDSGVALGIKYAVVQDPISPDPYLSALLARVPRHLVLSGMGERPALTHLRDFGLPGYTTGSGCLAPARTQAMFEACQAQNWDAAASLRSHFLPLEELRDAHGPARVLHAATTLSGLADLGPIPPFVSALDPSLNTALLQSIAGLHS